MDSRANNQGDCQPAVRTYRILGMNQREGGGKKVISIFSITPWSMQVERAWSHRCVLTDKKSCEKMIELP